MRFRRIRCWTLATVLVPWTAPVTAQSPARAQGTLVVSNMSDNTVTVLDAASGRVVATLPTGEGPHEVAISHDGRLAFVSNYGVRGKPGNSITVIDVGRAAVSRTIDLQGYQRPHGMAVLPGDTLLAVTSEVSKLVLVLDVRSGAVVKTLPTNGRASHMLAVSARGDRVVTANIADNTISLLSLSSAEDPKVTPVGRQPEGIAISPDGATVWAGSNRDSVVLVVASATGAAADTIRGFGLPYRIAISRTGRLAVITDPVMANVRVFDAATRKERHAIAVPRDSLVATAEVPGSPSPEGVAISLDERFAFVTVQGRNRVITIDLDRGAIVGWAPTGTWSDGIGYSPVVSRAR